MRQLQPAILSLTSDAQERLLAAVTYVTTPAPAHSAEITQHRTTLLEFAALLRRKQKFINIEKDKTWLRKLQKEEK